eukprot:scaffold165298_cov39-Tisochrysis_lutea.AAC.2
MKQVTWWLLMHVQMAFAFALHMRTSTLHIAMCVARSKSSIEGCTLYIAVQSFRNIIRNISLADTFKKSYTLHLILHLHGPGNERRQRRTFIPSGISRG